MPVNHALFALHAIYDLVSRRVSIDLSRNFLLVFCYQNPTSVLQICFYVLLGRAGFSQTCDLVCRKFAGKTKTQLEFSLCYYLFYADTIVFLALVTIYVCLISGVNDCKEKIATSGLFTEVFVLSCIIFASFFYCRHLLCLFF